ncbi:energy-coupling factor transporter transmembrane component T [Thermosyntropha sp.]|uniref:energy-coupling factor transporter transmembrane component T n=1 Tax=Thermosyntropha sp. TaxID=2740820 RepID=UPI0025EAA294|nr:energy-coupling factor transporter transmembrane component T [Thermosyntropha sp.]MBO8159872.1 energy-coupling factor transporter transmembrane protein EcfT [Thermosyntropha sp.]
MFYQKKDNLIYSLHPAVMIFLVFSFLVLALVFSNPLHLSALFLASGFIIISSGNWTGFKVYLRYSFFMLFIIVFINLWFSKSGTAIFMSFNLGNFSVKFTLEALFYGFTMGIRLLTVISSFALWTFTVDPDRLVDLWARVGRRSAVMLNLSMRIFPLILHDFKRIAEIQQCRGLDYREGGFVDKIRKVGMLSGAVLASSLERSLNMAEVMYTRGYDGGERSFYYRDLWRRRDYIILAAAVSGLFLSGFFLTEGLGRYEFYPLLNPLCWQDFLSSLTIFIIFSIPAFLAEGEKIWLKSKSAV